jgi:hypothetical protein
MWVCMIILAIAYGVVGIVCGVATLVGFLLDPWDAPADLTMWVFAPVIVGILWPIGIFFWLLSKICFRGGNDDGKNS